MIVPHRGKKVYRFQIPIRVVKACLAAAGLVAVFVMVGFVHYQYTLHQAQVDLDELQTLRSVNVAQATQLTQLAKNTASLQEEMSKLNQLDAEVRRLLNKEELPGTSRSGISRSSSPHTGEGGPSVKPKPAYLLNWMLKTHPIFRFPRPIMNGLWANFRNIQSEFNAEFLNTPKSQITAI